MAVLFAGLHQLCFKDEVREYLVGDESNVKGRTVSGLVVALCNEIERDDVVGFGDRPGLGVGHDKVTQVFGASEFLLVKEFVTLRERRRSIGCVSWRAQRETNP